MRLVIARCSVDYVGRLRAYLPEVLRPILVKADGASPSMPTTAPTSRSTG
jgi:RecB family endonuclease NucS